MALRIKEAELNEVSQTDLAKLLCVSGNTIRSWESSQHDELIGPFPEAKEASSGREKLYNYKACLLWYVKYKAFTDYRKLVIPANDDESYEEAKRRKEWLAVQKNELELQESQKKLVRAEDVKREWTNLIFNVRSKLLALPARVAPVISADMDLIAKQDILTKEVKSVLVELASDEES